MFNKKPSKEPDKESVEEPDLAELLNKYAAGMVEYIEDCIATMDKGDTKLCEVPHANWMALISQSIVYVELRKREDREIAEYLKTGKE